MKLEDQVCSLESAKRLKDLGMKQESMFYWEERAKGICLFHRAGYTDIESGVTFYSAVDGQDDVVESQLIASAFTVAELGEMLEPWANRVYKSWTWKDENGELSYVCEEYDPDPSIGDEQETFYADTEANARAKMLIYLIEQGLILDGKGKVKG